MTDTVMWVLLACFVLQFILIIILWGRAENQSAILRLVIQYLTTTDPKTKADMERRLTRYGWSE